MYHHFVFPNFLMEKCSEMKYQMSTLYKYAEQKFDDDDDDDDGDDLTTSAEISRHCNGQ